MIVLISSSCTFYIIFIDSNLRNLSKIVYTYDLKTQSSSNKKCIKFSIASNLWGEYMWRYTACFPVKKIYDDWKRKIHKPSDRCVKLQTQYYRHRIFIRCTYLHVSGRWKTGVLGKISHVGLKTNVYISLTLSR